MRAGRLRHRLQLQAVTVAQDDTGHPVETYTTYATVWGSLEPLSAKEMLGANQQNAELTHKVDIRYRDHIRATDRILFGMRVFEIVAPLNWREKNARMEMMAREVL